MQKYAGWDMILFIRSSLVCEKWQVVAQEVILLKCQFRNVSNEKLTWTVEIKTWKKTGDW